MPEANLARLGPAVVVVASRDCPDAPGADKPEANCTVAMPCDRVGTPGRLRGGGIVAETAPYAPRTGCATVAPCRWSCGAPTRLEPTPIRHGLGSPGRTVPDAAGAAAPCRWQRDYLSRCEQRPISCIQEMGRCFLARYRPNVFSEGARTAKRRLPGKIFAGCIPQQRFSPLFTAQIIHNELILPKTGRSSMHFSDILP